MNRIVERIKREGVSLEKHYGDNNQYAYHAGKQLITYPAFENLEHPRSIFIIAHELGHHYQYCRDSHFLHIIRNLSRMKHSVGLILFLFLLWEEVSAWMIAWRICKEEKICCGGFWEIAFTSLLSYIKSFCIKVLRVGKDVLGFYLISVFCIKFLLTSEELNLIQPAWLLDIRAELMTSSKSYSEIISEVFTLLLTSWIGMLFMYLILKITMEISKISKV